MGSFTYEFTLLSNDCPAKKYSPWFVSPTNLHCSQTVCHAGILLSGLFPLRIYTALKQPCCHAADPQVCFPYEFTLLSNYSEAYHDALEVCFPYEFTLLSNCGCCESCRALSLFPLRIYTALKLLICHLPFFSVCFPYEFTLLSNLKLSKNNILQNISLHS